MRKNETVFLICVLACAGLFAARSITLSVRSLSGGMATSFAPLGVAGESRDVDMRKLKRLLQQRDLSDHEAEFYEPLDTPAPASNNPKSQSQEDNSPEPKSDRPGE